MRTLLVGDEPRDIVFAGAGSTRAFITTAHRGQNRRGQEEPTIRRSELALRADRRCSRPASGAATCGCSTSTSLGTSLGGTTLAILTCSATRRARSP